MSEPPIIGQTTLSPEQQLQLEIYREQAASWRHMDSLFHRFTSVVLPVSIAVLSVPFVNQDSNGIASEIPAWLPIAAGLVLMMFWMIYNEIAVIKNAIRFELIHEMEESWGIALGHKEWERRRRKTWRKQLRSRYLRRFIFGVYFSAALGVLLYFIFCK